MKCEQNEPMVSVGNPCIVYVKRTRFFFSSLLLHPSLPSPCRPQRMSNKYELFPTKIIITLKRQINFLRSSFTFIVIILFRFQKYSRNSYLKMVWNGVLYSKYVSAMETNRPTFTFWIRVKHFQIDGCVRFSFFGFRGLVCCL